MKRYALVLLAALCMLLLAACGTQKTDAPDTPDEPDAPAVEPTPVTPEKTPEELAEERRGKTSARRIAPGVERQATANIEQCTLLSGNVEVLLFAM